MVYKLIANIEESTYVHTKFGVSSSYSIYAIGVKGQTDRATYIDSAVDNDVHTFFADELRTICYLVSVRILPYNGPIKLIMIIKDINKICATILCLTPY